MPKIIAYRLDPIYEYVPGPGSVATGATMTCMVTGEVLEGYGGGGDFLAPEVVERLRKDRASFFKPKGEI